MQVCAIRITQASETVHWMSVLLGGGQPGSLGLFPHHFAHRSPAGARLKPIEPIGQAVSANPPTTITLPTSVVNRLKLYKTGGRSYAAVLEDLMDVVPPQAFLDWAEKELRRPAVKYVAIRKKLGVA